MTTLPSFVELMASLGINAKAGQPEQVECSPSSSNSSPSSSPKLLGVPAPSLRDQAYRSRSTRYSPYSSTFRRASVSSDSSSSGMDTMSERSSSCSPTLRSSSPHIMRKQAQDTLVVNVFGSSPDLSANTPISSYVRRKTPGTSPSSPSFPRESDDSRELSKPFIIPTLPSFLPSTPIESLPLSPTSELDNPSSLPISKNGLKQFDEEVDIMSRRSRLHTGIRISTPPKITGISEEIHHRIAMHAA